MKRKILIFRRGSIGDAVVSIPALNIIKEHYNNHKLGLLTNTPIMGVTEPIESIFQSSEFFDMQFNMSPGVGGIDSILSLRREIVNWGPDKLIYLSEPSNILSLIKEYLFFRMCNIRQFTGFPFDKARRTYMQLGENIWESEAHRLVRSISNSFSHSLSWKIKFESFEENQALEILGKVDPENYIALSVGAKLPDKNWGDANWHKVLNHIGSNHPNLGIICIGAKQEKERCDNLVKSWRGPTLNICGIVNPRISALSMKDALFYLGHDSGPMHLAALVGTPCIAIFSARSKPGVWFPQGKNNRILYPWSRMHLAPNKTGFRNGGNSIDLITPSSVIAACNEMLDT